MLANQAYVVTQRSNMFFFLYFTGRIIVLVDYRGKRCSLNLI